MRKVSEKRSFELREARKEHICTWCGKTIQKGTKYVAKPEHNKMLANLLEELTGYDIYTIKWRTRFFYCDEISWPFCSLECLSQFSEYTWETLPLEVRERMERKIISIAFRVKDIIHMMTALSGSKKKTI